MKKYLKYPHSRTIEEVMADLETSANGLSNENAVQRLIDYGANEIPEGKSVSIFMLIIKQFKSWLVIILIIAAIISWMIGHILLDIFLIHG